MKVYFNTTIGRDTRLARGCVCGHSLQKTENQFEQRSRLANEFIRRFV